MYDTAGQEDYDRLRPFSYSDTDVMVVCYALDNPDSLANVLLNWVPEVRYFCGNVPVLLVGCKKDLRDRKEHDYPAHLEEAAFSHGTRRLSGNLSPSTTLGADATGDCKEHPTHLQASLSQGAGQLSGRLSPSSTLGADAVATTTTTDSEKEGLVADVTLSRSKGVTDLSASAVASRSSFDSLDSVLSVTSFPACEVLVSYDEGLQVARKMGAFGYYECSAKTGEGSAVVLDAVVRAGMQARHKNSFTGHFRYKDGRMGR
jgi:GTPase SAR1 family protein